MKRALQQALAASTVAILAGCGSGGGKPVVVNPAGGLSSMPVAPPATTANAYTGTDSLDTWTLHLDDTAKTYSYSEATGAAPSASGTFTASNGFLSLGTANGVSLGYILEVPSRLAILRAGGPGSPLVVAVPETTCYSIPYLLRFQYIGMDEVAGGIFGGGNTYGSIVADSSAKGDTWQYESLTGTSAVGPASFAGSCSGNALSLSINTLFSTVNSGSLFSAPSPVPAAQTSLAIGPTGFWVAYQSEANPGSAAFTSGTAGMAEPAGPLSTSSALAGNYLGFVYESGTLSASGDGSFAIAPVSSPLAFTPTPAAAGSNAAATSLTGGVYPNDDVTQVAAVDTILTLGSQSSTINGYYPSASVTRPDPNQNCYYNHPGGVGTDAAGFPICTFPATAVVSSPEGKYAIFLTARDYTAGNASPNAQNGGVSTAAMQIYLYQQ
ncbi:MAG TPA: hypothetical protein VGD62_02630 [Acidobacteriaceae bacterium]